MKEYGVFDIIGPIMIGPSSSHTAGAARIGQVAISIVKDGFTRVDFHLHGSFAQTYKGHGTDKALLAGVLGFRPNDKRLRDSFKIADDAGITYNFIPQDMGEVHPNTVKIVLYYPDGHEFKLRGSSIGGGNIMINQIMDNEVEYNGKNPTIICTYPEQKGMIAFISNVLFDHNYNIKNMKTINKGNTIMLIVELDQDLEEEVYKEIEAGKNFEFIKYLG